MERLNQGKVLLVGDGDFSFTLAMLKNCKLDPTSVTTSNLASSETIQQHRQALDNMAILRDMGTAVFLETDACELHTHPIIGQQSFDRIIFNFPLADRHNIKKNRALLADFFSSSKQILCEDGQVLVTLCKGQGGTPADQPRRQWQDSWQVVAMATGAGLALTQVLPFDALRFPEYHSVGFRFQDKSFNTEDALVHIFEKTDQVDITAHPARSTVNLEGNTYSCSNYVASRIENDLSMAENNPVCKLRQILEANLIQKLGASVINTNLNSQAVKGHRSLASFHTEETSCYQCKENDLEDGEVSCSGSFEKTGIDNDSNRFGVSVVKPEQAMAVGAGDVSGELCVRCLEDHSVGLKKEMDNVDKMGEAEIEADKGMSEAKKDRKDKVNRNRTKKILAHGLSLKDSKAKENVGKGHETQVLLRFLPEDPENVYIFIKTNGSSREHLPEDLHSEALPYGDKSESNSVSPNKTTIKKSADLAQQVFHCRASLLEDLPGLCDLIVNKRGDLGEKVDASVGVSLSKECDEHYDPVSSHCNSETGQVQGHCVVASGQCAFPVAIMPHFLPASHQMIVVQKVNSTICNSCENVEEPLFEEKNMQCLASDRKHFACCEEHSMISSLGSSDFVPWTNDSVSSLMSTLRQSPVFSESSLTLEHGTLFTSLKIQGIGETKLLYYVFMERTTSQVDIEDGDRAHLIGLLLQVHTDNNSFLVCLLSLDLICSSVCSIPNLRLLWSENRKFMKQFQSASFPVPFSSICLFPLKFAHDLSFWERGVEPFDERQLHEIIRIIAGDLVINVELIDKYKEPESGKRSRCYRLHFLAYDQALTYSMSWQLQSQIRMELARVSGITLR